MSLVSLVGQVTRVTFAMEFTGDADDVCPISFVSVRSLAHPVGFDAGHAYECDSAVIWITQHQPSNPLTAVRLQGTRVDEVLHPLIVEGDDAHVDATRAKLQEAGELMLDKYARIRRAGPGLWANIVLFLSAAVVLCRRYPTAMIPATVLSFAHVSHQSCRVYPINGMILVGYLFSIFFDIYAIVHIMLPSFAFATRLVFAQCTVLYVRVFVDIRQFAM